MPRSVTGSMEIQVSAKRFDCKAMDLEKYLLSVSKRLKDPGSVYKTFFSFFFKS